MIATFKAQVWRPLRRYVTRAALNTWGQVPAHGYWESVQTYQQHHPDQAEYQIIIPGHSETIQPPWTLPGVTLPPTFQQTEFQVPDAVCYRVNNGRVASQYGDVIAADGQLIYDNWEEPQRRPQEHTVCTSYFPQPKQLHQTLGVIAGVKGGSNYYHFLVDVLPRLYLLKQSQFWSEIQVCYVNRLSPRLRKLCPVLAAAGLTDKQVFWADQHSHVQAQAVVATSLTGLPGMSYFKPRWVFEFLRATYLPQAQLPAQPQPRIYISRSRAHFRRVINEPEVLEVLSRWGYQPVWLEDLSFPEQVGLFQQARRIIAPHGAGLANLVWCSPGAKVLEFFSPTYQPECYWVMARQMGLDYGCLIGQAAMTHSDHRQHSIRIDSQALAQALAWLESDGL
ncbi:MAG: glycosyltransferase family 61 protein [Gloeomargarita sp. SKYBB_i_bin120]|nr:glycosyltransferase family 61 protein [Gloeomargarita sp. SKYB120]MDW8178149.1 glycosyltransferase family 61 protein [Gloeomargarita sp. SKYBB_i_bin120]